MAGEGSQAEVWILARRWRLLVLLLLSTATTHADAAQTRSKRSGNIALIHLHHFHLPRPPAIIARPAALIPRCSSLIESSPSPTKWISPSNRKAGTSIFQNASSFGNSVSPTPPPSFLTYSMPTRTTSATLLMIVVASCHTPLISRRALNAEAGNMKSFFLGASSPARRICM